MKLDRETDVLQTPDLQKTDNTEIFLNDRELARGCPISTLGNCAYGLQSHEQEINDPGQVGLTKGAELSFV